MAEKFMGIEIESNHNQTEESALYESRKMEAWEKLRDLYAQAVHELDLPEESLVAPSIEDKLSTIKTYLS